MTWPTLSPPTSGRFRSQCRPALTAQPHSEQSGLPPKKHGSILVFRSADTLAEMRANVLHILHDRAFSRARLGETEVELTLETSGREQIEAVKRHLTGAGYAVHEIVRS